MMQDYLVKLIKVKNELKVSSAKPLFGNSDNRFILNGVFEARISRMQGEIDALIGSPRRFNNREYLGGYKFGNSISVFHASGFLQDVKFD
jgi:hypothetical protein